eukprot:216547-Rhodomonas_salina.4
MPGTAQESVLRNARNWLSVSGSDFEYVLRAVGTRCPVLALHATECAVLRAGMVLPGHDAAEHDGGAHGSHVTHSFWVCSYAFTMRCPVLTLAICCYAISGTDPGQMLVPGICSRRFLRPWAVSPR